MPVQFVPGPSLLSGSESISRYLHVSKRTAYRWIMDHGLPAMRFPGRESRTSTALIDLWILTWGKELPRDTKAVSCREVDAGGGGLSLEHPVSVFYTLSYHQEGTPLCRSSGTKAWWEANT